MKNVVKLEHYYYPWELNKTIAEWVDQYNNERYHDVEPFEKSIQVGVSLRSVDELPPWASNGTILLSFVQP